MPLEVPPAVLQSAAVPIATTVREVLHGPFETVGVLLAVRGGMTETIVLLVARVRLVLVVRRARPVPVERPVAIGSTLAARATVPLVQIAAHAPMARAVRCAVLGPGAIGSSAATGASVPHVLTGPTVRIARIARIVRLGATGPVATVRNVHSGRPATVLRRIGTTATIVPLVPGAETVPIVVTGRLVAAGAPVARRVVYLGPEKVAAQGVRCARVAMRRGRRDRGGS